MKKGFTLIELLVVLVILAIIALITVPNALGMIEAASDRANVGSVLGIAKAGEEFYVTEITGGEDFPFGINVFSETQTKNRRPDNGVVIVREDGAIYTSAVLDNKCFIKDYDSTEVTISTDLEDCEEPDPTRGLSCDGHPAFLFWDDVTPFDFGPNIEGCTPDSETLYILGTGVLDGSSYGLGGRITDLGIKEVYIGRGITEIQNPTFANLEVDRVILSNTMEILGEYSFVASAIGEIIIPSGIRRIEAGAFDGSELEKITFANGIEYIGRQAFNGTLIRSVRFPSSLERIGAQAFYWTELEKITFPKNGSIILHSLSFSNNENLKVLNLRGIDIIGGAEDPNNPGYDAGMVFAYNDNLDTVNFAGEKHYEIGEMAFGYNPKLKNINFNPNSTYDIGYLAFTNSNSLKNADLKGVTNIGSLAFDATSLEKVTLYEGLETIDDMAFGWLSIGGNITIPSSVSLIGEMAFSGNQISSVIINRGVDLTIRDWAFEVNIIETVTINGTSTGITFGSDVFSLNGIDGNTTIIPSYQP
jgi:prepilin-type N-terminal cleavage/methylation domain-containing protein